MKNRKSIILPMAIAVFFSGPASAAPVDTGRIDRIFAAYAPATPGCAVGAVESGKVVLRKAYGSADLAAKAPLTPQSRFYMASVSKQFTAMAALLLVQEGRLHLDDSVRKYVPELPAYADRITIRQMLNHTSGLRDFLALGELNGDDHPNDEAETLRALVAQRSTDFPPGTEYSYSNSGYFLTAIIVQRITGERLDDFARRRIFAPLGMTGTRFQHDHQAPVPEKAQGYQSFGSSWTVANSTLDVVGDGGLYSSIDDMLKWIANFDQPRIGAQALAIMRTSGRTNDGVKTGYGMGLEPSTFGGLPVVGHGGPLVGFRTMDWWFPRQRVGIVLLCNNAQVRITELMAQVAETLLGKGLAPAPSDTHASANPAWAGLYRDAAGTYAQYAVRDGILLALDPERPLMPVGDRRYVLRSDPRGAAVEFARDGTAATVYRNAAPGVRRERVERIGFPQSDAPAYLGEYRSSEVSTRIVIAAKGGLTVAAGKFPPLPLVQTGHERFWQPATGAEIMFTRDASGAVTGFALSLARARGLMFSKTP